jgi:light-regulated signal transduction histidine kinase (bacteriophytochrome)
MPNINGFEIAKRLKENEHTRDIAIIFVTSLNSETLYGYEQGAVDYLLKPLDENVTRAKVQVFEKLYRQRIEVQEYVAKIEQINKQLDEFVYIVSHDLKAPLRGLASLTTFLEDELGKEINPGAKEMLELMKSRTSRMQMLIDGILHYSRIANKKTEEEEVEVLPLINNIIDLLAVPSNFRFEIQDKLPSLIGEKIKLHEVFQNLITNAIKYNDKESGCIKINCLESPESFQFSVEDNGMGIEPHYFEKIFGVFQTLQSKDKTDSTGIGLTIVKKIIEQRGGKIWVESELKKGTKFIVTWIK